MSGNDAIRGYLLQTLSTLLNSLSSGDWATVELEPNHASEKVDVRWTSKSGAVAVEQIKSSRNAFAFGDVSRWLAELVEGSPDADQYTLRLIGPCTEGVADLSSYSLGELASDTKKAGGLLERLSSPVRARFAQVALPRPQVCDLDTLVEVASGRLESFLDDRGLDVPKRAWRLRIVRGLCGKLLGFSTAGTPLAVPALVSTLTSWVQGIREEHMLHVPTALALTPFVTFYFGADGQNSSMELHIESTGRRSCYSVSGNWRWVGPYRPTPHERMGRYLKDDNPFSVGTLDPGVRKRATWKLCDPMAFRSRLEVEVGGRDLPRRLYYHDAPTEGVPNARPQKITRQLQPFETNSDVKPGLFESYFPVFGKERTVEVFWKPEGEMTVKRTWDPPELFAPR